jgi:hypothetical protein
MKIKWLIYYGVGSLVGTLVLSAMPTTNDGTVVLTSNYLYLSIGVFVGLKGRNVFEKHSWGLFFIPLIPLLLAFLGVL